MEDSGNSIESFKKQAFDLLRAGNADGATEALRAALRIDFEEPEVLYTLNCTNWWLEKVKVDGYEPYDRACFIMSQWKAFYGFLDKIGQSSDRCKYAVRRFVSSVALVSFNEVLSDGKIRHDPLLFLQLGRCYKGVGDYDAAFDYLQKASGFMQESGEALAELADVSALIGEEKRAKVLFREAFFVDPESIDIHSMESSIIVELAEVVRSLGIKADKIVEWIPVHGAFLGVFSVKRELKLVELSRLKQVIFTLENDVRNNSEDKDVLVPRLLNKYLWLLDYYEEKNESALISEVLLKIKIIDPAIYSRYIA
jgi:tetratricopeptide (TPR) repeat protein